MNAPSPNCSVRLAPSGQILAENLHHAEAQGFADAWNRLEASGDERALVAPASAFARRSPAAGVTRRRVG